LLHDSGVKALTMENLVDGYVHF